MQLDLRKKVLDYEQTAYVNDQSGQSMTYRIVIDAALNNSRHDEILTPEQKSRIFRLSNMVWGKSPKIDLTDEDRNFIIDRAGVVIPSALIYGRLLEFLDGQAPELSPEDPADKDPSKPPITKRKTSESDDESAA